MSKLNHQLFNCAVIVTLMFIYSCSSTPPKLEEESNDVEEIGEPARQMPFYNIEFDPSLIPDEWLHIIISDSLNGELEIVGFESFNYEAGDTEIIFLASGEDGIGFYQLIEDDDGYHFTLSQIENSNEAMLKRHENIAELDIFRIHREDMNGDGETELIVGADISGTAHNDEGMYPYHMIQFEVLSKVSYGYIVDALLTVQFNQELEVDLAKYTNDPLLTLLSKKYHSSFAYVSDWEVKDLMKNLIYDMGISANGFDDQAHEFATVRKNGEVYQIDMAWLNSGYYFVADEYNEFGISDIPSEDYPILYVSDREVEQWLVFDINVNPDSATFVFRNMEEGSEEIRKGTFTYDNEDRWIFQYEGYVYLMGKDSEGFEVVGENYDQ